VAAPPHSYDAIVVGLGGMGSAAVAHLAGRGARVLGLEQYEPLHTQGSSHGTSRMIRQAYYEDPAYVPLLRRGYELWRALERDAGVDVLHVTGGLMVGRPDGDVVPGCLRSSREQDVPVVELDRADVRRRFPLFHPPEGHVGVYEPTAGFVDADAARSAHLELARRHGAELRHGTRVTAWRAAPGRVEVSTDTGVAEAARLVLAAGPWMPKLVAELGLPLTVERRTLHWVRPADPSRFTPDRFPVWGFEPSPDRFLYGFPAFEGAERGVKLSWHIDGACHPCEPETVDRTISDAEIADARAGLATILPQAVGPWVDAATCLYTCTPDSHFVIDHHPDHEDVLLLSPCSGHGYKFCAIVGEITADLVLAGSTPHPIEPFRLGRFRS
jgi:sarcosine oxidase